MAKLRFLHDIKKISFLTGSGISEQSGIPTFRDNGGYWKQHDPQQLATLSSFKKNPELVWDWYIERINTILRAKPNKSHEYLSSLENEKDVRIITQNIDGLHQKAGSKKIIELHGNIFSVKCIACNYKHKITKEILNQKKLCPECENLLRPDVVWFDEDLDPLVWSDAVNAILSSELLVVIGSSLEVEPANELPVLAKNNSIPIIEINPKQTKYSDLMTYCIRKKAVEGLEDLKKIQF